jgi:arylsulfatase A-like enzyme
VAAFLDAAASRKGVVMMLSIRSAFLVLASVLTACSGAAPDGPQSVRLVDLFGDATVEGATSAGAPAIEPIVWRFDGADASSGTGGFQAREVAGLTVREGRLQGRATGSDPILFVAREQAVDEDDLLHAVEIAIKVSEGGDLAVQFDSNDEPDLERAVGNPFPWPATTPVVPGDEVQRYTLRPSRPVPLSRVRHVLIRPTRTEGASFEIESVRLVPRREHLAGIESGVGWHGMDGRFRESIVTRAPETVSFSAELPERPLLELALATIEEGAATFRLEVRPEHGEPRVFERTVSRPHRWYPARVPLDGLAGRNVTVTLEIRSEQQGFLGFWGAPAIRERVDPVARADSGRPRGVIVLLADTLRSDHVNAFGYPRETAPVLTALAAEGARAQDCVSQATWTKVSVPAIFTSLYPTTHTVAQFSDRLPVSATTMAEVFREAGYATLALTSISFTGQFTNLHQGYEEFHESSSLAESSNAKTAREHVDRLLPWLEDHRDVPFFVFLHVADPHSPYRAYAPFDTVWGEPGEADLLEEQIDKVRPHIENGIMRRFGMPTREELLKAGLDPDRFVEYELDNYDGSIRGMDVEVGRLIERLRELDLLDDTLLAFVSDHGTEFLDHDRHFHGQSVYGELNRVPMFFRHPGQVPAGVVLRPTVQTIDLMPTVLELAGVPAPDGLQGESLVPLMRATADGSELRWRRPAVTEKAILTMRDLPERDFASVALIADGFKLIHNEPAVRGRAEYELYDHRADPLNLRDLATERPEKVQELVRLLEEWRADAIAARLDDAVVTEGMDDAELEKLRSLGYLQ